MKITRLYRELLQSMNVVEDDDKILKLQSYTGEYLNPISITVPRPDGEMALPLMIVSEDIVNSKEDFGVLKFHPFAESSFGGQSEVQNALIRWASGKMVASILNIITKLASDIFDNNCKGYRTPFLKSMGKIIPEVPDKSHASVMKVLMKVVNNQTGISGSRPVGRFIMGRKHKVISCNRYAAWRMQLMSTFSETHINGTPTTNKLTTPFIQGLFNLVMGAPSEEDPSNEVYFLNGANGSDAPYFRAFLTTYLEMADHLNEIVRGMGKDNSGLLLATGWKSLLTEFDDLRKECRIDYEGNTGHSPKGEAVEDVAEVVAPPVPKQTAKPANSAPAMHSNTQTKEAVMSEETPRRRSNLGFGSRRERSPEPTNHAVAEAPRMGKNEAHLANPQMRHQAEQPVESQRPTREWSAPQQQAPQEREVHVQDALGNFLFDSARQPWYVRERDLPKYYFLQAIDRFGNPRFKEDGTPILEEISERELRTIVMRSGGMPPQAAAPYGQPQQGYRAPQQPIQYDPRNPANQPGSGVVMRTQPAPQYAQQPPQYGQPQPQYGQQPQYAQQQPQYAQQQPQYAQQNGYPPQYPTYR